MVDAGSVERRGLRKIVDIKFSRLYEQSYETGSISLQRLIAQMRYPWFFFITPTLVQWRQ